MKGATRRSTRCAATALVAALGLALCGVALGPLPADAECSLRAVRAMRSIEVAGRKRNYHIAVGPTAALGDKAPLVFLWHGFGSSGRSMAEAFPPGRFWPDAIVVAPEGLPRVFPGLGPVARPGWQIERGEHEDRDLAFFDALLEALSTEYCVDRTRVYSTGFSNGGYFSNLLGCQRARVLAAIAPVSGGGPTPDTCRQRIPVRIAHAPDDELVPFSAGRDSLASWSRLNGCKGKVEPKPNACVAPKGCAVEVAFCTFEGGHRWPFETLVDLRAFLERHERAEVSR